MSWVLAFLGFAVLIIAPRGRPLHRRQGSSACGSSASSCSFRRSSAASASGETEYGIGAIPLGGFVKITGMNPEEELDPEVAPRAYYEQPVWKRIVVIAAGPFVNLVIAFVILFALGFTLEKATAVAVDNVESGSPAATHLAADDRAALDQRRDQRRR